MTEKADSSHQVGRIAQLQAMANGSAAGTVQRLGLDGEEMQAKSAAVQKKDEQPANNTGLPGNLKSGIENLSGLSLDDVKVHYNSPKPAQFQAHALAQGSDIHMAPGQEKHLPHEAWHVVHFELEFA